MKANFLRTATWAMVLCASMTAFTACDEEDEDGPGVEIPGGDGDGDGQNDPDGGGTGNPDASSVLSGYVTSDMRLEAGKSYILDGSLQVQAPATLTIEEGVTITAKKSENEQINYILIERGAKIDAQGTAENPIVMTAEEKKEGAWGGLHICGNAPTNAGSGLSEIGNAAYGGNDPADNSGVLKYVRLEYTGVALDSEHESNGISFYGVGNGTEVSYIQTYVGSDDGLEFFGGTVNVDHCVVVDCTDDSYDWTEGWSGNADYLVAYQTNEDCDCLIEADNNGDNAAAMPVSHPVLNHLTLVGNNSVENDRGVRLRAGTQVEMRNAQITGKPRALTVETTETEQALADGTSKLENVAISGELDSKEGIYTNAAFVAAGNLTNQTFSFTDGYVGMDGGRGAVEASNMWMSGWTR